mmetsp:Transcript_25710/g.53710  ORF Transcript_25710/g.53710 Transcript_25710/m.53710 type:complete len:169 (-) Transcript_25710:157-663(-)
MRDSNLVLVPARFVVTMGHILAISMVKRSLDDNIRTSLDLQNSGYNSNYSIIYQERPHAYPKLAISDHYNEKYQYLLRSSNYAINVAYVCIGFELVCLFCGLTIFMRRVNSFQTLVHFCGSILTCWFVVNRTKAQILWVIVGWTNVTTALVEMVVLFLLHCIQTPSHW